MRGRIVVAVAIVALLFAGGTARTQTQGRVEPYQFTVTDTGLFLGSCGDFDILWDDVARVSGVLQYDIEGVPVRDVRHLKIIGQTVYYNSLDPEKSVRGGPGELDNTRIVYVNGVPALDFETGLAFKVMLQGYGPIFIQTGRTIFDIATGAALFSAGPDAFLTQDLDAMCHALR